ncbi:mannose-1-phosphate guanylyltransferase/mannose-6-phosphate isomerase [Pseudoxanthomonas mexicana]|jgi:mannose-1-phosphate guanylyltransferase/mannose-6-phosphate isomerase|uniref:Xanthan biosynthesis protein XanB n=1 Tax=Pseudoxanthomonas mexicana TaxID=128785 RepID=A0A7G9TCA7_PSEMX|nr:mannose-1-phosphate guanylyltransferase/mannose-6-phosphate isomerase [Pseudoxanthomonas mexicana]MBP7656134.1 mannose-1-phosphate guanylyltransferase/mannose-6-phosphate isomerase [Pseudoxanthomonas sp.]MCA0298835.1 mannose-1-phosphate guanylyltransferase/mannose-6-phosphate isomerase [Pseudomonadota bacterium]MCP1583253.1 mannose-1-phosphate guanylyltransferase/mannose-6-phosphate isomerase [Pseudoxanthomonas mexicana]QNN77732.1 mannose-1-phosphate guanylyltransferase/mannose-6-phosphate i
MAQLQPVLLSGGSGTRLWPLSREAYPKQFLPLAGDDTMVQATWRRVEALADLAPIVVANEEHRFLVAEQLRQVGAPVPAILLEPVGRNTAPAIAAAALQAMAGGADPLLLVLPSDHVVRDVAGFQRAVREASSAAEAGALVTFGIVPDAPETGFGYIQAEAGDGLRQVLRFVEKPDAATARSYLDAGGYYWNSGMFLFRASRYLEELARFRPDIVDAVRAAHAAARHDGDFVRLDKDAFSACPSDSIDYAVMEKTADAMVLPVDIGWNDVGSWSALWDVAERDADGNAHHGDVIAVDSRNSYAYAQRLVALVGVDDIVVVETDDAVLVARKDKVQEVKQVVARLKQEQRSQAVLHREVHRPWGSYDSVDNGGRHQVKRIKVKPGAALSLQMHHHRAEHWIVVSGTAKVTRGDETLLLSENESTYIPLGVKHRLENPGKVPLELIEVQSGSYLGEDDIVRFEDVYGRSQ